MRNVTAVVAAAWLMCAGLHATAETVTIAVSQNEKAPDIAFEMTVTVEDELMSLLYESGHIVTSNAVSLKGSLFSDESFGVAEAAEGYADYLVAVNATYGPNEIRNEELKVSYADLKGVDWRVVRIATGHVIKEGSVAMSKIRVIDADPYKQVRFMAGGIAKDALKAINGDSQGDYRR
jgi:hypothetical protein